MTEFVKVASQSEIALNNSIAVDVGDYSVVICHTRDGFFAVENKCTHQLQALHGGKIKACFIFCPLHGQRFNLKDGTPVGQLTDKPVPTFALKLEGDDILISPQPSGGEPD